MATRDDSTLKRNVEASKLLGKKMDRAGDRVVAGLRKAARSSSSSRYPSAKRFS